MWRHLMAFTASHTHLSLLSLFALIILAQARMNLYSPDYCALLLVQKGLGIPDQRNALANLCNSIGISCQRRLTNKSYVLRITRLVFNSYGLRGTLSPAIGRLSELKELSLQNNTLFDIIPSQIVDCRKLEILNLRNNQFSGKVPSELSSLILLQILDLASNKLSGNLNFLRYFPKLEKLTLADNMFTGKVPQSLKSFRNLRFLNISGNGFLEGPVPVMSQVEHLSADLTRKDYVPRRYILAENSSRSRHRSAVAPAQAPGPSAVAVPVHHKHNKIKRKVSTWILGFLAGVFAGSLSSLILSVLFKVRMFIVGGNRTRTDSGLRMYNPETDHWVIRELAFLEQEDGLESLEIIGRGGSGVVYKAPSNKGYIFAVKKILQPPTDAAELTEEALNKYKHQIKSEIKIVNQLRHRNLHRLLGHMRRRGCYYLVYEYMKNGSLQDALQQVTEGTRELDWLARHKIAVGIAAGLEYLHTNHTQIIIHRDLKPANVLLDDDMEAQITDFGLAAVVPDTQTHVTFSIDAGTIGYMAPEYQETGRFSEKCDIYSFGVLLGVLVMGKFPSDQFFQQTSEMSLVKWMRNVMASEEPERAIDPTLLRNGREEQILLVLKIACLCTQENPKERPNSKDVACMLIKH